MILINLLPHREEKRRLRKQRFFAGLGVGAFAGLVVVGIWFLVLDALIADQQRRNQFLTSEIRKLEDQIKDIAALRAEIDSLRARQRAVEDLQANRNLPVHLLNELVKQTPDGVYLTTIKQNNMLIAVTGVAQSNERVSEFLRNTAYHSEWLERPELVEIKAATVPPGAREQKRLFDFSVRVTLKRPEDKDKAAAPAAPGAPVPGAAPKRS